MRVDLQCMSIYSVFRFTVYVDLQCKSIYSVCRFTVYVDLQFMSIYSVCRFTVYVDLQCDYQVMLLHQHFDAANYFRLINIFNVLIIILKFSI